MWIRLLTVASMQAAKDTLCQDADSGRNPECDWRRKPVGDARRITFVCGAHKDCGVERRLVSQPDTRVAVEANSGIVHSTVPEDYDRKNAGLTKVEKRLFQTAKRFGATSSGVMKAAQEDAVKAGSVILDGGGVEGGRPTASHTQRQHSCAPSTHSSVFPSISLKSLLYATIGMHSIAYTRRLHSQHIRAIQAIHSSCHSDEGHPDAFRDECVRIYKNATNKNVRVCTLQE